MDVSANYIALFMGLLAIAFAISDLADAVKQVAKLIKEK